MSWIHAQFLLPWGTVDTRFTVKAAKRPWGEGWKPDVVEVKSGGDWVDCDNEAVVQRVELLCHARHFRPPAPPRVPAAVWFARGWQKAAKLWIESSRALPDNPDVFRRAHRCICGRYAADQRLAKPKASARLSPVSDAQFHAMGDG